ncbi:S41 family peptidase [Siphonobacter curvatus]|uniref:Tail specific protease domain-containing protein n=1 Tax=Siphonobacter curvatus TaxID=2094562 RepID=A0A2S7IRQ8_9BACT|nr:S41 family peptidase [Siphonobacter curvatus]PQA60403.1 hypothetical protein C5O19_12530 [Siphonobacter curvatus]
MRKASFLLLLLSWATLTFAQQNPASTPTDTTLSIPEKCFETFWQTFEDHYAFFRLRNIDWQASYKQYRPRVTATTSDDSLFSVLSQLVAPFEDDHINIIIPGKRQYKARKPSTFLADFPDKEAKALFWKATDATLERNGFQPVKTIGPVFRNTPLFSYTRSKNYGYIRTGRCFVSEDTSDDAPQDAALAGAILDSVLRQMVGVQALLVDARMNIGGNDEFSYAFAGRFTSKKVLGHSKQTRKGGYEDFTPLEKWYIQPESKKPFTRPVVVLTNDQTASAGDVLAMILKALPQTTLVGENTRGIYSDMYGFELPNQWQISLSNQRYYAADGVCYEAKGTPVDLVVKNTRKEAQQRQDTVLSAALTRLKQGRSK